MSRIPRGVRLAVPALLSVAVATTAGWWALNGELPFTSSRSGSHAAKATCPRSPGFTATKAANDRAVNCETAAAVGDLLEATGARNVRVSVTRDDSGSFTGPDATVKVVASLTPPKAWSAQQAALAVARSVGTTPDNVVLTDSELRTLYDGSAELARAIPCPMSPASIDAPNADARVAACVARARSLPTVAARSLPTAPRAIPPKSM